MAIDAYLNLITSEHRDKPNYIALLRGNLNHYEDSYTLLHGLGSYFTPDDAQGVQLDAIGQFAGVSRYLNDRKLADDAYRLLIKAAIARDTWNGEIYAIYDLWDALFPDLKLRIKDNQNMSMRATIIGTPTALEKEMILGGYIIPKPNTVRIEYMFVDPSVTVFTWDADNEYFAGWDTGVWQENN